MAIKSNLYNKYKNIVAKELHKEFKYKSIMEVPRIEKIVVNAGLGDATSDSKIIDQGIKELMAITGQKPVATKSKKSIATFKVRENQAIGAKVTLRKENM